MNGPATSHRTHFVRPVASRRRLQSRNFDGFLSDSSIGGREYATGCYVHGARAAIAMCEPLEVVPKYHTLQTGNA